MSSTEDVELKAGHPPAVKAGGMRVSRTHKISTGSDSGKTPAEVEEQEQYADPPPKDANASLLVSGAQVKGDKDFPPEAIKKFHDKPLPTKEKRPQNVQQNFNIQQPR